MQGGCQMNKKLLVFAMLVLLIIISVATIIAVAKTDLARFELINKTDQPVSISLTAENTFYYLTVPELTFTKCDGNAPNNGEPGMEKVHIDDAPYGVGNRFEYEND
jgi:hypothetical protein